VASYLRIDPANGVIEVGGLNFSPRLQRTPAATEAMFLMMERAFTLGYRRYEWKCDSLNAPSRRAAERLGFTYEGTFRQAIVYKGRNRDTAWFSILDSEWPALQGSLQALARPRKLRRKRQAKAVAFRVPVITSPPTVTGCPDRRFSGGAFLVPEPQTGVLPSPRKN
jgi:hypothetical protein